MKAFQVTLAINAPANLEVNHLASVKLDGVRAYVRDAVVYARSNKRIPNRYVQKLYGHTRFNGCDGELIVGKPNTKGCFQRTMSGVMSVDGEPDVRFYVFDNFLRKAPYCQRLQDCLALAKHERIVPVPHAMVHGRVDLQAMADRCLADGFEGVMLRDPMAPYFQGRCGKETPYLLRIKPKETCEVRIVGFEELKHNDNEAYVDERGRTKRSSAKAGKRGGNTLGKFVTEWRDEHGKKWPLKVGTGKGMTAEFRKYVWEHQSEFLNQWLTIEFQRVGMKDVPRSPSAVGIRSERDMLRAKRE